MEDHEVDLIDYLNVIWKRKYLIIGGTLLAAAAALVVSLGIPKTYEVSRTIQIGKLPGGIHAGKMIEGKFIETREALIGHLKDHRVLKMLMEKVHSGGKTNTEMDAVLSISTKPNSAVRYKVQTHDPKAVVRIADAMAEYIIKIHKPVFDKGLQITKEHEAELASTIRNLEAEIQNMKKAMEGIIETPEVDAPVLILLQANIEDRDRNVADLRRELKESRLSRLVSKNTSVIAADAPPNHAVKPRIKLSVMLAGGFGLLMFTFVAFFVEYIEKARSER